MNETFDISVILCTYNRCELLKKSIASILAQDCPEVRYELIIADNNSSDQTRQVCESFITQSIPIRYIFVPEQGVSYARNMAIAQAKAPILAFFDDDVCVGHDWVATIKRVFDEYPEIDGIGGKVLPLWHDQPPAWLTPRHWAPLALQDYGEQPMTIHKDNALCLVAANLALRSRVFNRIGLFSSALQRVRNGIGSMEDHELHLRLWEAGLQEMYVPEVVVTTEVQTDRLTKSYHRKWHKGHGHFYALMREPEFERSAGRLFDVPAHLYKQAFFDLLHWGKNLWKGDEENTFLTETRFYFFIGFFQHRLETFFRQKIPLRSPESASFLSSLFRLHKSRRP
jgi:glycosyltransferase involved in cell wall biosynthesis